VLRHAIHSKAAGLAVAALPCFVLLLAPGALAQEAQTPQSPVPSPAQNSAQAPAQTAPESTAQNSPPSETPTAYAAGVVHTVDGSPVPGASVRLVNTDTGKAFVSWTDESGKFQFSRLPAGHYTVEASQLGFLPASLDVQLGSGPSPPPLQLVLRVATLAELAAPPGSSRPGGRRLAPGAGAQPGNGAPSASNGPSGTSGNGNGGPGGRGGRTGGRGQPLPPGLLNAMRSGMGGFQQTDLTGEAANGQGEEAVSVPGAGVAEANLAMAAGSAGSSDSFLLQGTVGQGLSAGGFGRAGGFAGLEGQGQGGFGVPAQGPGTGNPFGGAGGTGGAGGFGLGGLFGGGGGGFGGGGGRGGGGPNGAQVGRLLRQNVNRVRFTLFDRYTNSAFDAKPFSINGTPLKQIGAYDERLGGTVGGPLKIPHLYNGSDKTYFFVNYQHEIAKNPVNTFSSVPTLAERNGCFTADSSVNMPFTTTPYTTQGTCPSGDVQVPINPAAAGLLAFIPMPNQTLEPGQTGQNYLLQSTTPLQSDLLNTHVLHTINSKWNVNGGYNLSSARIHTLSNFADIGGHQSTLNQGVTLGLSHTWSPRLVENMTLSWSRSRIQLLSNNSFGTDIAANLGITGVSTEPIDFGIPIITFQQFSGISDPIPSLVRNQTLRLGDSITWTHLKHNMTFGGELRRIDLNTQSNPNPRGGFVFTGIATGNDLADFLVGLPFNTTEQFGNPNLYLRSWGLAAYAQDDFRVSKTFTVQYGLRYEAVTPPIEINNNLVNLDITNLAGVLEVAHGPGGLTAPGLPRALIHGNYNNLEPRFGFAWQPKFIKKKTVVRGGYSIFYNESIYNTLARELAFQAPVDTVQALTTTATAPLTLQNGFPGGETTTPGFLPNTEAVDPNYKNGYAQMWSLGTETSITQNWVLDLTYTGTKGTNLDILRAPNRAPLGTPSDEIQANRIDQNATGFTFDQSGANSIYNALQVRLVHRFTHGILLQGIYTYGKSLDDSSSIGAGAATVEQQDGNLHAEYGLSTFDIRHQFRAVSMYELPFGQRDRWANHGWKEHVFGDWRLQNIFTWQTGTPFTVLLGGVASDNGTGTNFSLRPNITGNPNLGICGGSPSNFFNTGMFTLPTDSHGNLTYGDEPRGAVEGPCSFNWNMSLAKTFRFGPDRRHQLNISWQVSNLTNTPNYSGIGTTLPCFGTPGTGSGTGNASGIVCGAGTGAGPGFSLFGHVTGAGNMRTMALQARFNF
jgi:Carboxypeptidase regulatory-like domain